MPKQQLTAQQKQELLAKLQSRFEKHKQRHKSIKWEDVLAKLEKNNTALWTLHEMEASGGEPDVVDYDKKSGEYIFFDCSAESPAGRRSLCYDDAALEARKEHKPEGSAMGMAASMGVQLLTEEQYRYLQTLGTFDLKTSSWIATPPEIRKLGGSLFCDRRYNTVFTYHNGVQSYYGSRGFRGRLKV